ncbi:Map [Achromatium sp. WMS3]|nr:Map [Achromatium sp. WMS3]
MSISIKNPAEIKKMRVAGRLAAEVLEVVAPHIKPGVTTGELDRICHNHIVKVQRAIPAPLHYKGYPKSICTSINQQVCHGVPGKKTLKRGDILNIDVTIIKNGYHGDTSRMFIVGEPSVLAQRLVAVTREAMFLGIDKIRPGATLGDVGLAIQKHVESYRFSVVREYCGHGIGRQFHEEPQILHYGIPKNPQSSIVLRAGMCFTVEPIVNSGSRYVKTLPDGWTVVTKDRGLSAQWEHTILVTNDGHEVLTLSTEEREQQSPLAQAS